MTPFRKALSPYSPLRTPDGIHPAIRGLVAQPLQILLAPLGLDEETGELLLPRLEVLCDLNGIVAKDGYRPSCFDIPVALAGDLLLLSEAHSAAPGILWSEAHSAAYEAVNTISCAACRHLLSSGFPPLAELATHQSFVHGDLHFANVVQSTIGLHIIDHENMHNAPAYADIVGFLLACTRVPSGDVTPIVDDCLAACSYLSRRFGRVLGIVDVAYGAGLFVARLRASGFEDHGERNALCTLLTRMGVESIVAHEQSPR